MWTDNFQMYKVDSEKAEEPEIKLPTSTGSRKKARNFQENIYFWFIDYAKTFDCVNHNKLSPEKNLFAGQETKLETWYGKMDWFQIGKGVCQGCVLSHAYLTYMQSTSWETLG